jgi:hypothetical protein
MEVLNYTNGNKYMGQAKNQKPHGQGTMMRHANGDEKYEGSFDRGIPNGYGVTTYSPSERHEGYYKDGQYDGFGIYYFEGGARYEGKYKAGMQHDTGKYVYESGDVVDGIYANGVLNGHAVY